MTIPKPFILAPLVFFQAYLLGTVILFAFGPWNWFVPNGPTLYAFLLASQVAILLGYWAGTRNPALPPSSGTLGSTGRLWFRASIVANVLLALPTSYARSGSVLPDVVGGILDPGTSYMANIARLSEGGLFVVIEYVRILAAPVILSLFPLTVLYWRSLGFYEKAAASLLILFNLAIYVSVGQNKGLADLLATLAFLTVAGGLAHRVAIRSTLTNSIVMVGFGLVAFFFYFGMTQLLRQGGAVTGQRGSFGWSTSTPGSFDAPPEASPAGSPAPSVPLGDGGAIVSGGSGAPAAALPPQTELPAVASASGPQAESAPLPNGPSSAPGVGSGSPAPAVAPSEPLGAADTPSASAPSANDTPPVSQDAAASAPAGPPQAESTADPDAASTPTVEGQALSTPDAGSAAQPIVPAEGETPTVSEQVAPAAPPSPADGGPATLGEPGPASDPGMALPDAAVPIDPMPAIPTDVSFGGPGAVTASPDHIVAQFAPDFVRTVYESFARYLGQGYQALTLTFDLDHSLTWGFGNSMFFARNADRVLGTDYFVSNSLPAVLETETGWSMFHLWHSIYPWIASDVGFVGTLAVMALIGWLLAVAWIKSIRDLDPMWGTLLYLLLLLFFYIPANNQLMQSGETAFGFTALLALVAGRSLLRRMRGRRSSDTLAPSG